jgi:hypothetical protein
LGATAGSGGTLRWYDASTGGTSYPTTGSPWFTPVISSDHTYYVAEEYGSLTPVVGTFGTSLLYSTGAGYTPYYTYYESSKNQMLFLASELTAKGFAAGNISSLALNLNTVSTTAMTNFTIPP